jgi:hypothetical protein
MRAGDKEVKGQDGQQMAGVADPGWEKARGAAQTHVIEFAQGGDVKEVQFAAEEQVQAVRAPSGEGGADEVADLEQAQEIDQILAEGGTPGDDATSCPGTTAWAVKSEGTAS